MEAAGSEKAKQKRVRKSPYRKWTEEEQRSLVCFLRENIPIEKPTAQLYYKRFLNDSGITLDWSLVRCKVKNLRQTYNKAKSWGNSTGAGTLREGETTRDVIVRMCPLFDDLEEIFGYRECSTNACVLDTESSSNTLDGFYATVDAIDIADIASPADGDASNAATTTFIEAGTSQGLETSVGSAQTPRGPPRRGIYSRTALADVLEIHSSLVESKKAKLEAEMAFKEKELQLKKEQLDFEKEKHANDQKLRMLELEMKERVAMKELEFKKQIEMEKLKMQM